MQDNLEIIKEGEHQSFHNKGINLTEEHRKNIGEANKRRKGKEIKKRYNIPPEELYEFLQEGKSVNWIAKYYGVDWSTIKNRIHDNPELMENHSIKED